MNSLLHISSNKIFDAFISLVVSSSSSMTFINRKLLFLATIESPKHYSFLPQVINSSQPCPLICIPSCPPGCLPVIILPPEPQPLPDVVLPDHDHRPHHPYLNLFFICMLILIVLSTLLLMFNVVYSRILRSRRSRNTMRPILNHPPQGLPDDRDRDHWDHGLLLDEQQRAMVVDHHVWYINTVGLPSSVIESIALCKYKSGDGIVDGTDCAVCLSEFEEGENLRLLPKCNHAFHVPCIDTWLRSHTNCPMCRAPVMPNTRNNPNLRLPQPSLSGANRLDNRSSGMDSRSDIIERRREGLVDTKAALRRTFSMDSALCSSVVCSPSHIESVETSEAADSSIRYGGEEGSCSSSSSSLLQRGLGSMKRSMSCTGMLLSSRYA